MILVLCAMAFTTLSITKTYAEAVDDSVVEQRLRDQGLDRAPGVVEVPPMELHGFEQTSGYVDENGRALSEAEYQKYREDQEKGIFQKYPIIIVALFVLLGAGAFVLVKRKKRRR